MTTISVANDLIVDSMKRKIVSVIKVKDISSSKCQKEKGTLRGFLVF
jgi:hypothetical protein